MQRRITIALLGTALAAILLVGLGVLGLASIGAERDARDRVTAELDAVAELVSQSRNPDDVGPVLGRLGDASGNSIISIGRVGTDGALTMIRRGATNQNLGPALSDEELKLIGTGEAAFTRVEGTIRGVQLLEVGNLPGTTVIIIQRQVATIGSEARVWFLLSGGVVLVGAALAASVLARRFVQPIRRATAATEAIANGDLGVRVPVDGSDEIADLGSGINSMATELERGRAAEQQFLLSVSHDLRTPLTALRGFGEALEDGTMTDTARAGAVISHNANRLGRLVGDLLDLGKLEAKQFRFDIQSFDAAEVVSATAGGLIPSASERGIELIVEASPPLVVSADPDRLGQAVANLVENATAFAASTVSVSLCPDGADAVITVTDDGPGIDPTDVPHVFERLYVTKLVPERSESPSGLGLAIVRELIGAMNGSVDATLPTGGGTAMVIRLPLAGATPGEQLS